MSVWKRLASWMNCFNFCSVPVHMRKISSIYRLRRFGGVSWVIRKFLKKTDMNIFAAESENAAPIAVPLCCWNTRLPNSK